jgi:hypothetical protein
MRAGLRTPPPHLVSAQTRSGATAGCQGAGSCWVQKGRPSPGMTLASVWSAARARPRARARVLAGREGACLLVCKCACACARAVC